MTDRELMEGFFRKYAWALNFGLVGLGALLTALVVNGAIALSLVPLTVPPMPQFEAPDLTARDGAGTDRDRWVDGLKARCLFGCPEEVDPNICPDGCPEGEVCERGTCVPEEEELADEYIDDGVPLLTDLPLKVTGAMVATNPRWSMAMIQDVDTRKTHVAGVGDILPIDAEVEVTEIRRDRVFIRHDGRTEYIRMEDLPEGESRPQARSTTRRRGASAEASRPSPAREGVETPPRRTRENPTADRERAVRQEADNRFTVDRATIERHLEDPASLSRQARIMPNYRDGEPNGLRLVGVTPNSFYSDLGIRSGDVIHSINGRTVTNQREAMEMLEAMGRGGEVKIEVERRGRMQEMEYNIQ